MKRLFGCCAGFVVIAVLCVSAAAKTAAKAPRTKALGPQIAKLLAEPAAAQAHWGIAVTAMDGTPIYSMNEAQLFQPASNAKLFTTAAALALLGPGTTFETKVVARGVFRGVETLTGDLVLVGAGDANLSGREIPYVASKDRPKPAPGAPALQEPSPLRYLEVMADQIAATGLKVVDGDVVGDDTLFPWDPYPEDWAIDDAVWGYGAPVSALTIIDNQIKVTVTPAAVAGEPATVVVDPGVPSYYTLDISVTTGAKKSGSHVQMERAPGAKVLRVYGSIAVDAHPDEEDVAIHDPAEYAAIALKEMLEARGIVVTGKARARHKESTNPDGFVARTENVGQERGFLKDKAIHTACLISPPPMPETQERVLASHRSPSLEDDVTVTNKVSQNLHAELLLHDLGRKMACGDGSTVDGARFVRAFLEEAGIDKNDFVFFDGSGLSGHDLVTPRATARLLQYASTQPWFADWRRSLPVGGEDGSLMERFAKAPLAGHVFAKTGTLGEARALSGYLDCASGKTVIFSIMVGNHLPQTHADRDVMDQIVAAIAATN